MISDHYMDSFNLQYFFINFILHSLGLSLSLSLLYLSISALTLTPLGIWSTVAKNTMKEKNMSRGSNERACAVFFHSFASHSISSSLYTPPYLEYGLIKHEQKIFTRARLPYLFISLALSCEPPPEFEIQSPNKLIEE